MRVFLAGVFVCTTMFLVTSVILEPLEGKTLGFSAQLLIVPAFFVAIFIAMIAFNRRSERWPFQTIEELEKQGLVESTEFQAKRALHIEEFEDEGSQYYLELSDGSVLFLCGQYLYDYEPIDDDEELNQERKFPCTCFTAKRHKTQDYVLEIITGGTSFEPEAIAPPFIYEDCDSDSIPKDGEIITDKTFDQIKAKRLKAR